MKISVITATFNSQRILADTISSLNSQDYQDIEYIVVDGGSTDETHAIINNYKDSFSQIVIGDDEGMYDAMNPAPSINWLHCSGQLDQNSLLKAYHDSDAMLFLSKEESFGFPLIEAMYLDLPIVCPDLPFARVLCGDDAIYFDPNDIESLRLNIKILKNRLIDGWQPNWNKQMKKIPENWAIVADEMLDLCI